MARIDSMTSPSKAISVHEAVRALRTELDDRAADIEAARRVPRDVLDSLIDIGCFRLLLPLSHGGIEADLGSALSVFEELARADA